MLVVATIIWLAYRFIATRPRVARRRARRRRRAARADAEPSRSCSLRCSSFRCCSSPDRVPSLAGGWLRRARRRSRASPSSRRGPPTTRPASTDRCCSRRDRAGAARRELRAHLQRRAHRVHRSDLQRGRDDRTGADIIEDEFAADQSVVDEQLRARRARLHARQPVTVPVVAAARIGRTFNVFRPFQQVHFEAERQTPIWVVRVALFSYWVLVPFAVLGVVVAAPAQDPDLPAPRLLRRRRRSPSTFTIGAVRYRGRRADASAPGVRSVTSARASPTVGLRRPAPRIESVPCRPGRLTVPRARRRRRYAHAPGDRHAPQAAACPSAGSRSPCTSSAGSRRRA